MEISGNRLSIALSIVAALFLIALMILGLRLPQSSAAPDYTLSIEADLLGETVVAQGSTNLPDGARLTVVVDRMYRLKDAGTWVSARVGEAETAVSDGRWRVEVPLEEETWVQSVSERVRTNELDPVHVVSPKLRASVIFSPLVPQPGVVWETMGGSFEGLAKSEASYQAGSIWLIRRQTHVEKPLRRDLEQKLMAFTR